MRKSIRTHWQLIALVLLLAASGCRGLDNDSDYEIRTYASFLMVQKPDGTRSIYQYRQDEHKLDSSWNTQIGVSSSELSDAEIVDNYVWVASGAQRAIHQVSPGNASVKETFGGLPLAPHYLAVGQKQILIADTAANKVAFVKRRNGNVQEIEFEGKPGFCIYNSGKFYLQKNDSMVTILDETAMTPRATVTIGLRLDVLLLSRYRAIVAMMHDSTTTYRATIDPNADFLVGEKYPVFYSRLRPTPYFSIRYGSEYLRDLELLNATLIDETGTALADSVVDFEADFFEGTLFYSHGLDLVVKRIAGLSALDSFPMNGRLIKSFHQYAPD